MNFSSLIEVGVADSDDAFVSLCSEILNDEASHAASIFEVLPKTPAIDALCEQAHSAMRALFSRPYLELARQFPHALARKVPRTVST